MNRIEFMRQLENLLQNISPTEREEALQYYNDYFNDAGVENEQNVIEALGNPAKVAETIRKDLSGSNNEEIPFQREVADDKAVVAYEKDGKSGGETDVSQNQGSQEIHQNTADSGARKGSFEGVWENMKVPGSEQQDSSSIWQEYGNAANDGRQTGNNQFDGYQNSNQYAGYNSNAQGSGYQNDPQYGGCQNSNAQGSGYQNDPRFGGCQNSNAQGSGFQNNSQYGGYQNDNAQGSGFQNNSQYGGYQNGNTQNSGWQNNGWQNQGGQNGAFGGNDGYSYGNGAYSQSAGGYSVPVEKKKMSTGLVVLIVVLCAILSPAIFGVVTGIAGTAFGLLAGWFGMILGFGITAIVLIILAFVFTCIGVAGMFVSPFGGLGMIGGGLVCAGLGILFLMLTIAMAGVATPAIFRGIKWVWNSISGKRKAA